MSDEKLQKEKKEKKLPEEIPVEHPADIPTEPAEAVELSETVDAPSDKEEDADKTSMEEVAETVAEEEAEVISEEEVETVVEVEKEAEVDSEEEVETVVEAEKEVEVVSEEEVETVVEVEEEAEVDSEEEVEVEKEVEVVSEEEVETVVEATDETESVSEEVAEAVTKEEAKTESVSEEVTAKEDASTASEEEVTSSDDHEEDHHDEHPEEKAQKDYHSLSKKELIEELRELLKVGKIQELKHDVEEIRTEFSAKFAEELEHKKEEFLAQGGNLIDFHYTTPLKKEFNSLYFDYKEKRNNHYKNLKKDLQANLAIRLELIEELKGLLNAEENINTTYKHFKDIQERWHEAGAIPRDKYNIVWNTYRHHVENFYDFLHLNREFRDLDFKHNLEQKIKLIGRAEELAQEEDINKAFRELQMLHKMWKEDVGPVAKEYREEVWDKFSLATKVIHDKRHEHIKDLEDSFEANFDTKKELVDQIMNVAGETKASHQGWQQAIKKVQALRDQYFEIGRVPRSRNKEIWNAFKDATRHFNHEKNNYYKSQKKEQFANLEKKRELIKIAEENKDSDDFDVVTPLMKKIQSDWKSIGHVPRRDSDKIWKQFKEACNHYFDRLHAQRNEANQEEVAHLEAKSQLLESLSDFKPSGDKDADVKAINEKITAWKEIGRVPYNKRNIERKFNKVLDHMFGQLNLGQKETELIRFENKLNSMASEEDNRKLQNEEFFISKKIGEAKNEIRQLENNLGFFQHADQDNPLVQEVHKNIAKHKEQLDVWKTKLTKIRSLRKA